MFTFRILVDIALKAHSPAINGPTTAVLAIDQAHRLLRVVGQWQLHEEVVRDGSGRPRVIFRTRNWKDFVHVACDEIRACGPNSVQIARRMRAMLQNLLQSLPLHRQTALQGEHERLNQTAVRLYFLPGDLALARVPDSQGLGGSSGSHLAASG